MKSDEFYIKLKASLEETTKFPSKYLYKFIVPTGEGVKAIEDKFDGLGAVINTKASSKGKYTAVSVLVLLDSAEAVIAKYKEVSTVKGVLSL
jgi:putative lipoic acid-binding regulatory protein